MKHDKLYLGITRALLVRQSILAKRIKQRKEAEEIQRQKEQAEKESDGLTDDSSPAEDEA